MGQQWYISRGHGAEGPFSARQIQALAKDGALQPSHHVWQQGMSEWATASRLGALFRGPNQDKRNEVARQVDSVKAVNRSSHANFAAIADALSRLFAALRSKHGL